MNNNIDQTNNENYFKQLSTGQKRKLNKRNDINDEQKSTIQQHATALFEENAAIKFLDERQQNNFNVLMNKLLDIEKNIKNQTKSCDDKTIANMILTTNESIVKVNSIEKKLDTVIVKVHEIKTGLRLILHSLKHSIHLIMSHIITTPTGEAVSELVNKIFDNLQSLTTHSSSNQQQTQDHLQPSAQSENDLEKL